MAHSLSGLARVPFIVNLVDASDVTINFSGSTFTTIVAPYKGCQAVSTSAALSQTVATLTPISILSTTTLIP